MTPLCELALKHGTDKGGNHTKAGETCHNYTPTYHKLLAPYREQVKAVLEIGVNYGPSLRMWSDYFPNARIIGLDSNADCLFSDGRIECFAADQNNAESLEGALTLAGIPKYDLIVDDGSHEEHHQVFSANVLSRYLAPNGVYVIEDITWDCKPEHYLSQIHGYEAYTAFNTGVGIGKAHCACCNEGERLLVLAHNPDRIFP
jgi:predicted O-methyltransferase YrrM